MPESNHAPITHQSRWFSRAGHGRSETPGRAITEAITPVTPTNTYHEGSYKGPRDWYGADNLSERVEALGKLTLRGDIERWVTDLEAAGEVRRAELIASYEDRPLVELVRLVDEYGGGRVLEAVGQVGARLRRERRW